MTKTNMPVPFGVKASVGTTRPPLTEEDLDHLHGDSPTVLARSSNTKVLAIAGSVNDEMDLTETGWGVLFASDADPSIKEKLQPLLDLRRKQVQDDKLFKVFEGPAGVQPGQSAESWARSKGVALSAPVEPRKGVPFYLLLVGSPARIPFEFQALLDLQWAVGRLHFDNVEDYGSYARNITEYEKDGFKPVQRKSAVSWLTRNPADVATAMLSGAINGDFLDEDNTLGARQHFSYRSFSAEQATKSQLQDVLRGKIAEGPPAILFTGSHGAEWPLNDPDKQRELQGALVTQEWSEGNPLDETNQFSGDDLPADAQIHGLMAFLFACFGGGCPSDDNYYFNPDGSKIPVAPEPMISRLPQVLLGRGALAVIAHIDRAFAYTFENVDGTPQVQLLRTPLELLMRGKRVGLAADALNLQWSSLAAQLGMALGANQTGAPPLPPSAFASLYIARDDARNYVVLGDPAVRLRTESLS